LAAMLIAQYPNNDGKPLYGSYVIGSNWWFTILIGEDYCSSREFNMDNRQDLLQIVFILKRLKTLILER
jgi:hypothetical protein